MCRKAADPLLNTRNLDTSSFAISLPLASSSLVMERGVLHVAVAQSQKSPRSVDPRQQFSQLQPRPWRRCSTAPGKSYFTKLLALRHRVTTRYGVPGD